MISEFRWTSIERDIFASSFRDQIRHQADTYQNDNNNDIMELTTMVTEENESYSLTDEIQGERISYSESSLDDSITSETKNGCSNRLKKYVNIYVDLLVPPNKCSRRSSSDEIASDGFESKKTLFTFPFCMLFISLIEIICYILNQNLNKLNPSPTSPISTDSEGPIARYLIYNPYKRQECWRFLTYMMVHIGWLHLTINLMVQLFLGMAVEVRNCWWRVLTVYITGVIAGSLIISVTDPRIYLAGASGGVYALITAHVSNLILNWTDVRFAEYQLTVLVLLTFFDISTAIYSRIVAKNGIPEGHPVAHIGGAVAGLLVGFWVVKNRNPTKKKRYLWWAAFIVYCLLMGSAVLLNVFWTEHYLPSA